MKSGEASCSCLFPIGGVYSTALSCLTISNTPAFMTDAIGFMRGELQTMEGMVRKRIVNATWLLVLTFGISGMTQNTPARGPSTPEERAREVAITRKLEAAPLDKSITAEREWALKWLIEVPDLTVSVCPSAMGKDFLKTRYKYSSNLVVQLTLSSAAFIIEHPGQASDKVAMYTAGAEGVLKAYAAILKDNPKDKWKALDEPVEKQGQGQLADYVRENSRSCK